MKKTEHGITASNSAEVRSKRLRRRARVLQTAAVVAVALAALLTILMVVKAPLQLTAVALFGLGWLFHFIGLIVGAREVESSIEAKETQIESRATPPGTEETALDLLKRHIQLAVKREEISMILAEQRANVLYQYGRSFLVASILAPIAAALIYLSINPLPTEILAHVKEIKEVLGELPAGVGVSIQRDWRILLGGVSFGFLLLAAAAGLFRQQRKEVAIYSILSDRISCFKRLESVLSIRNSLGGAEQTKEMIELAVEWLLNVHLGERKETKDSFEGEPKATMGLIKTIRDISE